MRVEAGPRGVVLPDLRIALDVHVPGFASICSHAHGDHVPWGAPGTHATIETKDLLARRAPDIRVTPHALGEPFDLHGATITFLPAGHVLGSALTKIAHEGETLLYTGDFKTRPPATCAPCAGGNDVRCDTLIVESTFGLPIFQLLDGPTAGDRMRAFAEEVLSEGAVPVFLGYNLGKAHEIARLLGERGVPVMLHGAAWNLAEVYRGHGVAFPLARAYARDEVAGHALIVPPSSRHAPMIANLPSAKVAYCSGWATLENQRVQRDLDALIPLSDHADYPDLLAFVRETRASRVIANHGYADVFSHILRTRFDIAAEALHVGEFEAEDGDTDPAVAATAGAADGR